MSYLIDFFESLSFDTISQNIEFSTKDEQVTIRKGNEAYLFLFSKVPSMFRSNLCQEIVLIPEDDAHLKLDFNNQLAEYLKLKFQKKSVEKLMELKEIECPEEFVSQLEEKLVLHPGFNYIYLTLKIKDNSPEHKQTKKSKI